MMEPEGGFRFSSLELSPEEFQFLTSRLSELGVSFDVESGDVVVRPDAAPVVRSVFDEINKRLGSASDHQQASFGAEETFTGSHDGLDRPWDPGVIPDGDRTVVESGTQEIQSSQLPFSANDLEPAGKGASELGRQDGAEADSSTATSDESRQRQRRFAALFAFAVAAVAISLFVRSRDSSETATSIQETCAAYSRVRESLIGGASADEVEVDRLVAIEGFTANAETGAVGLLASIDDLEKYEMTPIERQEYWIQQFSQAGSRVETAEQLCNLAPVTTIAEVPSTIQQVEYTTYFVTVSEGWGYQLKLPREPFQVAFRELLENSAPGNSQLMMTVSGLQIPLIEPDGSKTPGRNPPSKEVFVHYYLPTGTWGDLRILKDRGSYAQCRSAAQPNFSCRFVVQTDDIAVFGDASFVSGVESEGLVQAWVQRANGQIPSGIWEIELWTPDTSSTMDCSVYLDADWNLIGPIQAQQFFEGAPELSNIDGWSSNDFSRPSCPQIISETGAIPQSQRPHIEMPSAPSSDLQPQFRSSSVTGPFPTSVPLGECSRESIGEDFGVIPFYSVACSGAWAITGLRECSPDMGCEGTDIFRWTEDGWSYRGRYYSLCVLMIDESGLPRSVNDEFFENNQQCVGPIQTQPESSSGSLQRGDLGQRVRVMQLRLIEWNLLKPEADGRFGPNTQNAIYDFQHLAGLNPTGVADKETLIALGLPFL